MTQSISCLLQNVNYPKIYPQKLWIFREAIQINFYCAEVKTFSLREKARMRIAHYAKKQRTESFDY